MSDKDPQIIRRRYFRVLGTQCDKMCLALSALGGDLDYDPLPQASSAEGDAGRRWGGGRRKRAREHPGERMRAEVTGITQCWNPIVWLSALQTGP